MSQWQQGSLARSLGPRSCGRGGSLLLHRHLTIIHQDYNPLIFVQVQRYGVDAVSQPRWLWAIFENMPQVRFASAALYLGPPHSVATILFGFQEFFLRWGIEARPSASRIKLCLRPE